MFRHTLATFLVLAISSFAVADTVTNNGSIDGTEPTFDNPQTVASTLTSYDTVSFSVDTDGMYSFLSFYPGDTAIDENLDGHLLLDADGGLTGNLDFDDDYNAGDVADLAAFDSACVGSNCSGFDAALTAGTTYTVTQTSFTDVDNTFGSSTGPYEQTWTGPGAFSIVPESSSSFLSLIGVLGGMALLRRRRR